MNLEVLVYFHLFKNDLCILPTNPSKDTAKELALENLFETQVSSSSHSYEFNLNAL